MNDVSSSTKSSLFDQLKLPTNLTSKYLDLHDQAESRFIKDLKINVGNVLKSQHMSAKETSLLALATAMNEKNQACIEAFEALALENGATDPEVLEVAACVSLMNANNIFYRFRHFMHDNENYQTMPAAIRMSVMMNPLLGKELFELISLGLSAINGCEQCVTSHEASVKIHGGSEARIFDAIR